MCARGDMLETYRLIKRLQEEIGNGAEVRFSARNDAIEIRIDWWNKDFHALQVVDYVELVNVLDDSLLINRLVAWCKNAYARKLESGA